MAMRFIKFMCRDNVKLLSSGSWKLWALTWFDLLGLKNRNVRDFTKLEKIIQ
jgi:hypothetical protein